MKASKAGMERRIFDGQEAERMPRGEHSEGAEVFPSFEPNSNNVRGTPGMVCRLIGGMLVERRPLDRS